MYDSYDGRVVVVFLSPHGDDLQRCTGRIMRSLATVT